MSKWSPPMSWHEMLKQREKEKRKLRKEKKKRREEEYKRRVAEREERLKREKEEEAKNSELKIKRLTEEAIKWAKMDADMDTYKTANTSINPDRSTSQIIYEGSSKNLSQEKKNQLY